MKTKVWKNTEPEAPEPTIIHITQQIVSSVVTGASRRCLHYVAVCVEFGKWRSAVGQQGCEGDGGVTERHGHRADQSRAITVERGVEG